MNTELMTIPERLRVLGTCPAFASTPAADLALLAEIARCERLAAGDLLFEAGEAADRVYVLVQGRLAVIVPGQAAPVRHLRAGDMLGEYGLFGDQARTATVRAETTAELLSVDNGHFRAFLLHCPQAALVLLKTAVERLTEAERRLCGYGTG